MEKLKKFSIVLIVIAAIYGLYDIVKGVIYISDGRSGTFHLIAGLIFVVIAVRGIVNYRRMKDLEDDDDDVIKK